MEKVRTRSVSRKEGERNRKKKRRRSWIRPWLHACKHIRAYPLHERFLIFQKYISLTKLPKALAEDGKKNAISSAGKVNELIQRIETPSGASSCLLLEEVWSVGSSKLKNFLV